MTPIRTAATLALAEEWSLVLEAEGFSPEIRTLGDEFVLLVPEADAHRAVQALWAYERENPEETPVPDAPEWPGRGPLLTGVTAAVVLTGFFLIAATTEATVHWYERGRASAELIVRGEFWRAVTALTLHADFAHALSNAIAAAFFLTLVGTVIGPGVGAALILAAGAAGNIANAIFQGSLHTSVGASTAVFGAIGLLGGIGFARRRRQKTGRGAWLPLAASVALLAMIGTGGPRVDLWAHLWGLVIGGAAGFRLAASRASPLPPETQWKCGLVAIAVILVCWMMAFA